MLCYIRPSSERGALRPFEVRSRDGSVERLGWCPRPRECARARPRNPLRGERFRTVSTLVGLEHESILPRGTQCGEGSPGVPSPIVVWSRPDGARCPARWCRSAPPSRSPHTPVENTSAGRPRARAVSRVRTVRPRPGSLRPGRIGRESRDRRDSERRTAGGGERSATREPSSREGPGSARTRIRMPLLGASPAMVAAPVHRGGLRSDERIIEGGVIRANGPAEIPGSVPEPSQRSRRTCDHGVAPTSPRPKPFTGRTTLSRATRRRHPSSVG